MQRRSILFNDKAQSCIPSLEPASPYIRQFHRDHFDYRPTPLTSLPEIAKEVGVKDVYIKTETSRFGLPSFKILGASWGVFRAVAKRLDLPLDAKLNAIRQALSESDLTLYAATDGNHGRAIARMGTLLRLKAKIYVPSFLDAEAIAAIETEGAKVFVSTGDYDAAVADAVAASHHVNGILVQDTAFDGYTEIPQWIVDGYSTMMQEIDEQLHVQPDLVICPVGVGSFAQSVVHHYKQSGKATKLMSVEPDTAPCVWKSIQTGKLTNVPNTQTAMTGLNCGTPSTIAWPLLRAGLDASSTICDLEAHRALQKLQKSGLAVGPCGAAPLASLLRLTELEKSSLGLNQNSTVVLLCTEGPRTYNVPLDVSISNEVELCQTLVSINSANPGLGSGDEPGETAIAEYITAWLQYRDIEAHWIEPVNGRPSVIGIARGSGGGKSLMLNGHTDTVTLAGYDGDALGGEIKDGKMYGRGAADMKSGLAAAMITLANAKQQNLKGDVILAAVADEENASMGTEQILAAGWKADAALVNESTNMEIIFSHKGYVWFDIDIYGVAAHGSAPAKGVDAICKAGYFLAELDKYSAELQHRPATEVGPPSAHASLIRGGEEASSYPAQCTITIERRTVAGETKESTTNELKEILEKLEKTVSDFKYDLKATFERPSFHVDKAEAFPQLVAKHTQQATNSKAQFSGAPYWTDAALLKNAGISALLLGPIGDGFHGKEEWVDVESVQQLTKAMSAITKEFCA